MSNYENCGIADQIILTCTNKDGQTKWMYDSIDDPNSKSIVNTGMAHVAALILADVGGTAFDYVGIGTGTTASAATDTDMEVPVKRKVSTGTQVTTTVTNDTAQFVVSFSSADSLSGTSSITEAGVFNAVSAGVMLFRKTFTAKNVNWDDGDTLDVTAKCQIKQGA